MNRKNMIVVNWESFAYRVSSTSIFGLLHCSSYPCRLDRSHIVGGPPGFCDPYAVVFLPNSQRQEGVLLVLRHALPIAPLPEVLQMRRHLHGIPARFRETENASRTSLLGSQFRPALIEEREAGE